MAEVADAMRLPGVYFLPPARNQSLDLPPMDCAAFVGFAERGALNTPLLIEEFPAYQRIFGEPFTVGQTPEGDSISSRLPETVATFFANGGKRCYVVRVAGAGARRARFTLPHLVRVVADGTLQPVQLEAPSEGAWANAVQMATRLQSKFLPAGAFSPLRATDGDYEWNWDTGGVASALQAGDVLRLKGNFATPETVLILPLLSVEPQPDASANQFRITAGQGWLETVNAAGSSELRSVEASDVFAVGSTTIALTHVERLRFELVVREAGKPQQTFTDLAFFAPHPRFWGTSGQWAGSRGEEGEKGRRGDEGTGQEGRGGIFLPQGMSAVVSGNDWITPQTSGREEDLGADDLDPFPTEAFFDASLTGQSSAPNALMQDAEHRKWVEGRNLLGMHALMFQEEVALLAAPDAARLTFPLPKGEIPGVEMLRDSPMLRIHAEMQRLCEARRDVLGIVTLPAGFERRHCLNWLKALRLRLGLAAEGAEGEDSAGQADLSYLAAYHPWLLVPDAAQDERFKTIPADGTMCGMIARRERERGVWISPANMPLFGVFGIAPLLPNSDRADLFEAGFNLPHAEPRDFRVMSAQTLSRDRSVQPISVRRLMMVLRKMLLEGGQKYVFQNNSPQFREAVRLSIVNVLQRLFERGAFAGANPAQAYRVTTDASVNPPDRTERGQFVVEVAVAPSQPTEFIVIRLIRSDDGSVTVN